MSRPATTLNGRKWRKAEVTHTGNYTLASVRFWPYQEVEESRDSGVPSSWECRVLTELGTTRRKLMCIDQMPGCNTIIEKTTTISD